MRLASGPPAPESSNHSASEPKMRLKAALSLARKALTISATARSADAKVVCGWAVDAALFSFDAHPARQIKTTRLTPTAAIRFRCVLVWVVVSGRYIRYSF